MSRRSPELTDAALELAIARRAPHGVDVALLGEIVARAAVVPQRRSWWRDGGADRAGRLVVIAWVAIALIVVLAVGALVGGVFDREQADLSQIASTRPTASPSDTPSGPSPTLPARTPAPTATLVLAPIRTAFEIPLTVAIGEDWSIDTDTADTVDIVKLDRQASRVTILRPYGYDNAASLVASLRGTPVDDPRSCTGIDHPGTYTIAGSEGLLLACSGEIGGRRVLFPLTRSAWRAGYPTSGGSAHGWFSLSRWEFGTIVVVDVRGGPVVVAIHANVDGRAYSAFEVQAEEMLRSVTLGP